MTGGKRQIGERKRERQSRKGTKVGRKTAGEVGR